jgi:hypothetical protein
MKTADRNDVTSLAASYNGAAFGMDNLEGFSVCAAWVDGGSLAGAFKLQASNNAFTDNVNLAEDPNAIWVDVTGSEVAVSASGSQFWNVADCYYRAFRIVWTRSAGTGSATAFIHAKGIQ